MNALRNISRRTGWDATTALMVGAVGLFLVLFLAVPLANVFRLALWTSSGATLHYVANALRNPATLDGFRNALLLGVMSTAASILISMPLAYAGARWEFPGKRLLGAGLLVPMILPPFVGAIGMQQLLGPYGVLNAVLVHFGLVTAGTHVDWFAQHPLAGVVVLQTLHLYPIIYLNLVAALANVDPSLEDAARNLGAGGWAVFRRVTLPLVWPGLFAGATLVFLWALTDLGTPLMFGFREVTAVQIFNATNESGQPDPNALVVLLLVMVAVIYYAARTLVGRSGHEMMARSVQVARGRRLGPAGTAACWLMFGAVIVAAALPHVMVILTSVADRWTDTVLPTELTGEHHATALGHELTLPSIRNSLFYALAATALCAVLAVWAGYVIVRKRFLGRTVLDSALMLPLAIPGLVLAFGFLNCYHDIGQWFVARGWWRENYLYPEANPILLLVIAYAVRRLPYMLRSAVAGFEQTSRTLEEAAMNVGASPLRMVMRITIPLVMANILAGGILVFTFSMLEVSDSLVLAKQKVFFPLTKAIWWIFEDAYNPEGDAIASALGVWAMVLLASALLAATLLLGKKMGAIFRA